MILKKKEKDYEKKGEKKGTKQPHVSLEAKQINK